MLRHCSVHASPVPGSFVHVPDVVPLRFAQYVPRAHAKGSSQAAPAGSSAWHVLSSAQYAPSTQTKLHASPIFGSGRAATQVPGQHASVQSVTAQLPDTHSSSNAHMPPSAMVPLKMSSHDESSCAAWLQDA